MDAKDTVAEPDGRVAAEDRFKGVRPTTGSEAGRSIGAARAGARAVRLDQAIGGDDPAEPLGVAARKVGAGA